MKPTIRTNNSNVGIEVFILNPDLKNLESTYLTADAAASASSFTVQRGTGFSANTYIVADYKTEYAELLLVGASAATTLSSISPSTSYAHTQDTEVRFIPYNMVEIYTSSDDSTYSLLTTVAIQPDKDKTIYLHTTGTAATYYKIRFKNSTDTTYSPYSDSLLGSGFGDNTVYSVKKRALGKTNEKIGNVITDEYLNDELWEARRIVHDSLKRWSFRQEFQYDLGTVSAGERSVTTPTNLQDRNTTKNISAIHIGTEENMTTMTKREWDEEYEGVAVTTVATQTASGDTTLVLADTADLEDSGTVAIWTSGSKNSITYTSKDDATNTLSGVPASGTGSIDATHVVGTNTWQNGNFGLPLQFTVFENTIYFDVAVGESYHGENIWIDYYKAVVANDSDADTFDEPMYDFYVNYLIYSIRKARNQGVSSDSDPDYKLFSIGIARMMKNEVSNQKIRLIPQYPRYKRTK